MNEKDLLRLSYIIVDGDGLSELESRVNELIVRENYFPIGGVAVWLASNTLKNSPLRFGQAMVRESGVKYPDPDQRGAWVTIPTHKIDND